MERGLYIGLCTPNNCSQNKQSFYKKQDNGGEKKWGGLKEILMEIMTPDVVISCLSDGQGY